MLTPVGVVVRFFHLFSGTALWGILLVLVEAFLELRSLCLRFANLIDIHELFSLSLVQSESQWPNYFQCVLLQIWLTDIPFIPSDLSILSAQVALIQVFVIVAFLGHLSFYVPSIAENFARIFSWPWACKCGFAMFFGISLLFISLASAEMPKRCGAPHDGVGSGRTNDGSHTHWFAKKP